MQRAKNFVCLRTVHLVVSSSTRSETDPDQRIVKPLLDANYTEAAFGLMTIRKSVEISFVDATCVLLVKPWYRSCIHSTCLYTLGRSSPPSLSFCGSFLYIEKVIT